MAEYKDKNRILEMKRIIQEKNMIWKKKSQRIGNQICGSKSTDAWNIVKSLKTNNASRKPLINMEKLE